MKTLALSLALAAALVGGSAPAVAAPKIGVYYYPGWSAEPSHGNVDPWTRIRPFADREPLIGWYADSARATVQKQADMMQAANLDYVAFDWYYENGVIQGDRALNAYIALTTPRPAVSLLWANHGGHTTTESWHGIVDAWAKYFSTANFFKIDGKNVIFVFNAGRFAGDAQASGATAAEWTAYAQAEMQRRGLPPIYFVGEVFGGDEPIVPNLLANGFSSVSAYNMHRRPHDLVEMKGYANLDAAYRAQWQQMARFVPKLKPIIPITSGWDHTPWGPMPARDGSIPTPAQFKAHLEAARDFMTAKDLDAGVICCWNEYGEGSFIEPTKRRGNAMLNDVKTTFPR